MSRAKTISTSLPVREEKFEQPRNSNIAVSLDPDSPGTVGKTGRLLFAAALFCSGAAALVYQVLWIKQLSLVVGVEVYSIAVAVSAFFAGLALGGFVLGRWADRVVRPLLLYASLEVGIAILGIISTVLLAHSAAPFVAMQARVGVLAWLIPYLLVGIPAFCMGGTLPVAVRSWVSKGTNTAKAGGSLYAINTAGGIVGALLSSFAFLPWFGVRGTAFAAAGLNVVSAAIAFTVGRNLPASQQSPSITREQSALPPVRVALILYAFAGAIALGYEVVWSQAIIQFLSTRSFAFSIVLATYLAGLVCGSALYARFAHKVRNPWGVFGLLIAAAGVVALVEIAALSLWQLQIQTAIGNFAYAATRSQLASMCARFFVAAVGIVFLPTVLLGAAFPAALHLIQGEDGVGSKVGSVIALNTAGGIVGTLVTGFLLVPKFGLVRTLGFLAVGASAIGVFAAYRGAQAHVRMRWAVVALGIAALFGAVMTPPDRLARLLVTTRGGGGLVFYEESKGGTVAVVQQKNGPNVFRRLFIQGVSNSGDAVPSLRYMRLQALLPLIIHQGEPHSALVIGFGTGITAGALLQYPKLQNRVCAELLPAVVKAGPAFRGNFDAYSSPELKIRTRDGRQELLRDPEQYDLITLEPPPPSAAGVSNLYSSDFYELAGKRLQPDGLFAQWLPLATQNNEDTRSLVRSFLDSFPYATLWTTELHEMLLIGSFTPIELDIDQITDRFNQPQVASALGEVGISSPAALMATWVTGRDGLEHYAAGIPPVTDDHPRIEYAALVRSNEITRTLPALLALRTGVPLKGADDAFHQAVAAEQQSLLDFYSAGIAAYNGDREAWNRDIASALKHHLDNPYYGWAIGKDR
jgi:spermidine synthase